MIVRAMPGANPREEDGHQTGGDDEVQIDLPTGKGWAMTAIRRIPLPAEQPGEDEAREADGSEDASAEFGGHVDCSAGFDVAAEGWGFTGEVDGEVVELLVVLLAGVLVDEQACSNGAFNTLVL